MFVEVSADIPSSSPIIFGRVHRIGQIGSFVRIPVGFLNLYAIVTMVGASEAAGDATEQGSHLIVHGQRWIEIQLIGESYGQDRFQRGVSVFPTLDDEVHVVTEADLSLIYSTESASMIEVGTHSASEALKAFIDLDKLVTRHGAILGSTGSGKSNTVARLLKSISGGTFPNSMIVVIDPHGEYGPALAGSAKVFSIGSKTSPLIVPYWALAFDELAWFLVDRKGAGETLQDALLRDRILQQKRASCTKLKAGNVTPEEITVDSPIPFSLKELGYYFDRLEKVTYKDMGRTVEALLKEGNQSLLRSAQFESPGAGSSAPFKPAPPPMMASNVARMFARLRDPRFAFLLNSGEYDGTTKDLDDLLGS